MYKHTVQADGRQIPHILKNGNKRSNRQFKEEDTQSAHKGAKSKHHHEVLFCTPQTGKNRKSSTILNVSKNTEQRDTQTLLVGM